MKNIFSFTLIILCFVMIVSLTACTESIVVESNKTTLSENTTFAQNKVQPSDDVVLSDVLDSINIEFSISSDLVMPIETPDDLELFYNVSPADVKQFAAQTAINSSTDIDEIILIEAVDGDAAKRVYDALEQRYSSQRDLCASYSAELLTIIEKCSVEKNDNFVTLIMSSEAKEITEYYYSLVG